MAEGGSGEAAGLSLGSSPALGLRVQEQFSHMVVLGVGEQKNLVCGGLHWAALPTGQGTAGCSSPPATCPSVSLTGMDDTPGLQGAGNTGRGGTEVHWRRCSRAWHGGGVAG